MATVYTDHAVSQEPAVAAVASANTWSRPAGAKSTGNLVYREVIYTVPATGAVASTDILRLCKLPVNFTLVPHLCKVVAEAMGTAFVIAKIGDATVGGNAPVTDPDDDDRYSTGNITATAGGAFDFVHAAAAGSVAGYTTSREMWLSATLGTVTAPTPGKRIRFVIAGVIPA